MFLKLATPKDNFICYFLFVLYCSDFLFCRCRDSFPTFPKRSDTLHEELEFVTVPKSSLTNKYRAGNASHWNDAALGIQLHPAITDSKATDIYL